MLDLYRVLDLTDENGLLCGKLLGDLGADVIKIERPGGDPARNIGPFYRDEVDPEKSLFWWAFNTSKRGVTLNIETVKGQETFKRLVKTADFVIESFPPGYMDRLGLGYKALEKINPGIIMVSITPFGQTGPYKDYKSPDIVAWAMGGQMYPCGDADRPPFRISHHSQAYLHAAGQAAVGAMMALCHREQTGEGQQVDVSIHESVVQSTFLVTGSWDMMKVNLQRGGAMLTGVTLKRVWPCKDGYLIWFYFSGESGIFNLPLIKWMDEEGMAEDFLKGFDWQALDLRTTTQDLIDRLEEPARRFFLSHTKAELLEGAVSHQTMLYPVATTVDMLNSTQLAARKYWTEIAHPELGTAITYPGTFAVTSGLPPRVWHRAPLIGEHNKEIYDGLVELGQTGDNPGKTAERAKKVRPSKKPLEGVKIADFSRYITGPLATKTLADYGAQVIRIEGRTRPDFTRTTPPFKDGVTGLNRSGCFNQYNTSKLSIALNLARPRGVEIAKQLVAWADVVVENFAGGAMERMGFGYEELKKIKPDIIMLSTCMQGQKGPHSTHAGYGYHLTALSGATNIAGWPDREPPWLGPYTDYIAPHFNAFVLLAALDYRRRTGKGLYFDMSQYENGIQFLAPLILDYVVNGRVADRMGNRNDRAAPHGAYRCRGEDRWCAIAVFTDDEWRSFCRVMGNPGWANNLKFSTLRDRKNNEDELDRLIEEWTVNYSPEEVMTLLQKAGVGAGVLQNGEDLLGKDPQLKHRKYFWELDHSEIGKHCAHGQAFTLSKTDYDIKGVPLLGEHNERVLKEILGMSDEEIAELVIEGILE